MLMFEPVHEVAGIYSDMIHNYPVMRAGLMVRLFFQTLEAKSNISSKILLYRAAAEYNKNLFLWFVLNPAIC